MRGRGATSGFDWALGRTSDSEVYSRQQRTIGHVAHAIALRDDLAIVEPAHPRVTEPGVDIDVVPDLDRQLTIHTRHPATGSDRNPPRVGPPSP